MNAYAEVEAAARELRAAAEGLASRIPGSAFAGMLLGEVLQLERNLQAAPGGELSPADRELLSAAAAAIHGVAETVAVMEPPVGHTDITLEQEHMLLGSLRLLHLRNVMEVTTRETPDD